MKRTFQPKKRRITPACAGKSSGLMQRCGTNGDHPRMCGEKPCLAFSFPKSIGSPPHVRGKDPAPVTSVEDIRITPACAGKSRIAAKLLGRCEDHPRMCGEKRKAAPALQKTAGSPPHVRGKEVNTLRLVCGAGITPACAGKSRIPCTTHSGG